MIEGVKADSLGKRFEGTGWVFRGLSFEAERGSVLAVVGPNGSGKTTVLSIAASLLEPTEGRVYYPLAGGGKFSPKEARPVMGYVAPQLGLWSELTGMENMVLIAKARGVDQAEAVSKRVLEEVGVAFAKGRTIKSYSTGMLQRLKLAQALVHSPDLLVLDEPASNLDGEGKRWLLNLVTKIRSRGGLVLLATNDEEVAAVADKIVELG